MKFFDKFKHTKDRIKTIKISKKILALLSLGSILGFIAFLPVIIIPENLSNSSLVVAMIVVGYALMIFFFTISGIVLKSLGIAEALFEDYKNFSNAFHINIIIFTMLAVICIAIAKFYAIVTKPQKGEIHGKQ